MNGVENINSLKKYVRNVLWLCGFKPNLNNSKIKGDYGEWVAKEYLKKQSFQILDLNWRSNKDQRKEIDLVCFDQGCLVFVEVKTRQSNSMCSGYESINLRKRKALLSSFKFYLNENLKEFNNYRFDIVEIDIKESKKIETKVFHHENIAIFNDSLH